MSISDLYQQILTTQLCGRIDNIPAIILAAGRGQRLFRLTDNLPKPLLPVLNFPIILWRLAKLQLTGVKKVCANVHYLPEAFVEAVKVCATFGLQLDLVQESCLTGPLGGAIICYNHLPLSDTCLIFSGDALADINLQELIAVHYDKGAELTITTASVSDAWRYGVLDINEHGFVTRMREKTPFVRPIEFVSCGIYVISTRLLSQLAIPKTGMLDFVDLISDMIKKGEPVAIYAIKDWLDVGTPESLLEANLNYLNSHHVTSVGSIYRTSSKGELWVQGKGDLISKDLIFEGRVLLGSGVKIEQNVTLRNSVIGDGAIIQSNTEVTDSLLFRNSVLAPGQYLTNQIVESQ